MQFSGLGLLATRTAMKWHGDGGGMDHFPDDVIIPNKRHISFHKINKKQR